MENSMSHAFNPDDLAAFTPAAKVALLATVTPGGLPHLSLITSLQAKTTQRMYWGEFCRGTSKTNVRGNPKTGFLIMTMDRRLWRGSADYDHSVTEGEDYEFFNKQPMFRYNSYFGINTVHYMDLVRVDGPGPLPLTGIVLASLLTRIAKGGLRRRITGPALNPWGEGIFNRLNSLKFMAVMGDDGYPFIIPLLQCQAADSNRLAFSPLAYGDELRRIKKGSTVAVMALTMEMESVVTRGVFAGFTRTRGVSAGYVDIDWVYNSMPPAHGVMYPPQSLEAVTRF